MTEAEIIQHIRRQDEQGMDLLLQHYGPLLRYVIGPILSDPRDREDCLSHAAMRVWNKIGLFDPDRGSWTAWLTTVARNVAIRWAERTHKTTGEGIPEDMPDPVPGPEDTVLRQEMMQTFRRVLARQPSGDRALIYRKYYYKQSTEQIANELRTTKKAVEGRLYRIKKRLRKEMEAEGYGRTWLL